MDLQRSQAKGKGKGATKSAEVVKVGNDGGSALPSGDGLGRKSAAGGALSSSTQQHTTAGGDGKDVKAAAYYSRHCIPDLYL